MWCKGLEEAFSTQGAADLHSCLQLFYAPRSQPPVLSIHAQRAPLAGPKERFTVTLLQAGSWKLSLNSGRDKSQGGKLQNWPFSSAKQFSFNQVIKKQAQNTHVMLCNCLRRHLAQGTITTSWFLLSKLQLHQSELQLHCLHTTAIKHSGVLPS